MVIKKCKIPKCKSETTPRSEYCRLHQNERIKKYHSNYNKRWETNKEMPTSAKKNVDTYALWKFAETITPD
jgi:hypothetical protein